MHSFSKREQQIMDTLHTLGRATAEEVRAQLPDSPSNSAIRTLLSILEKKGHVKHAQDGPRYVYMAAVSRERAGRSAVRHLLDTFFAGSAESAVAALIDGGKLSDDALDRLSDLIAHAKKEGR